MAPIKSSVDLAMERTEGMRLSEEDRQRQREREADRAAAALLLRWEKEELGQEELEEELRSQEAEHPRLRALLLRQAVRRLALLEQDPSLLELMRMLDPDKAGRLREVLDGYRREAESRRHALREQARLELMRRGVSGTAVEPNESAWEQWKEWAAERQEAMREELLALVT